jgi:protein TonB
MSVRMMSSELDSPKERLMLLLCVLFGHALLLGLLVVQRANMAPKPLEIELALSASEPAQTLPPLAAKPTLSPIPVLTPKATPAPLAKVVPVASSVAPAPVAIATAAATSPPAPSPPAAVPTQSHTELAASAVPQNVVVSQTTTTVLPNADAAYLTNPKPSYPPLSRRLGEQGIVMLNVLVGEDGNVQKLEVAKSSGSTRLDEAASRAVQSWRFAPGKRAGIAQTMWVKVPISFILEK